MKARGRSWVQQISTRRSDFSSDDNVTMLSLGGINLYSKNENALRTATTAGCDAIARCLKPHLTLQKKELLARFGAHIGFEISPRLFGALLGRCLCFARIHSYACLSKYGRTFRVFVHAERAEEFRERLVYTARHLKGELNLDVDSLQGKLFSEDAWGHRETTLHLLSRLAFLGLAAHEDDEDFSWPSEIENAVCDD